MPEFHLAARSAIGGAEPARFEAGGYLLKEHAGLALASVAARQGTAVSVASELAKLLGVEVPAPGRLTRGETYTAFWFGPDQWLVAAPLDAHELLAGELKDTFGDTASVSEQTDGWVCVDVSGPDVATVLERLTSIDVRSAEQGAAVRTVIEHIGCFVLFPEEGRHIRIIAGRSFAGALFHTLQAAVKSVVALGSVT